jgi:hypothetical protein
MLPVAYLDLIIIQNPFVNFNSKTLYKEASVAIINVWEKEKILINDL